MVESLIKRIFSVCRVGPNYPGSRVSCVCSSGVLELLPHPAAERRSRGGDPLDLEKDASAVEPETETPDQTEHDDPVHEKRRLLGDRDQPRKPSTKIPTKSRNQCFPTVPMKV